jgi:hypothetical protein
VPGRQLSRRLYSDRSSSTAATSAGDGGLSNRPARLACATTKPLRSSARATTRRVMLAPQSARSTATSRGSSALMSLTITCPLSAARSWDAARPRLSRYCSAVVGARGCT